MKKFLFLFSVLFVNLVNAQNGSPYWSLAGNSNASSSSKLGTTNSVVLRFFTNNSERARFTTSGLLGIGTTSPTDKVSINSPSGTNGLRVQINSSTKLLSHSNGGLSIGGSSTPPSNGLFVSGNAGFGTSSPTAKVHVLGSSSSGTGLYARGYNYGVHGEGTYLYGVGVFGSSGYIGLSGSGTDGFGSYGSSTYTGAYGYGDSYGLYGSSSGGKGVYGYSSNSYAGHFESYNNYGLVSKTTNGFYAGVFYGSVWTSGSYYPSDKNLKKNAQDVAGAMSIIRKLKPQNYEFKNEAKYASLNLPKGLRYGFMSQDIEQVLPGLVTESEHELKTVKTIDANKPGADGLPPLKAGETKEIIEKISIKGVNYVEFIPIMVKALQEQDITIEKLTAIIENQNTKIEELIQRVDKLSPQLLIKSSAAYLKNSVPNPAGQLARIGYNLPENVGKAQLVISNALGQTLKQFQLTKQGFIDVDTSKLSAGSYSYTLVVDGATADSKMMVVKR